jgi:class 3 adenylate cyclase
MDHTTNRTFICSVVFLDIVDYSQQPVDEQIRLKSRFNVILSEAIKDVAVNDRIILDTGDGAAISFLGDPEDALFVALSIRDAIIGEDKALTPPLSARIGINLGPVKLVQDINGQRNLIGDGINVAQRVMSFAKPGQVLVSRSYFEVISRLSQEYAKLFHYEGSRADKHVREHQVYSVYPEEKEKAPPPAPPAQKKEAQAKEASGGELSASAADTDTSGQSGKTVAADAGQPLPPSQPSSWQLGWNKMLGSWGAMWLGWKKVLGGWSGKWLEWIKLLADWSAKSLNWNAIRNNRAMLYVAAALIVILISVPIIVWKMGGTPTKDTGTVPAETSVATSETAPKAESPAKAKKMDAASTAKKAEIPIEAKKVETAALAEKKEIPTEAKTMETPAPISEDQKKTETTKTSEKPAAPTSISLGVAPWGEVYVDGNKKGVSPPLNSLQVTPGKHQIEIRNTTFPPYKQTVDLKPGEQLKIKHKFR